MKKMVNEISNERLEHLQTEKVCLELCFALALEKLQHIGTLLTLSHGIFIAIELDDEGEYYTLLEDCADCGERHFLKSYMVEEVLDLNVIKEATNLIENYFIDID